MAWAVVLKVKTHLQISCARMQEMQQQQGGSTYCDSSIIDGEAREVTPDAKKN